MFDPKANKQPKAPVVVPSKSSPGKLAMADAVPSHSKIRERAYEFYESRGREPGQDEQDWLRAEGKSSNKSDQRCTSTPSVDLRMRHVLLIPRERLEGK